MNKNDFDVLDNSLTLRNLTPEQKKSIARLMELAIEEALLKKQSFQQSVQPTLLPARYKLVSCPHCKFVFGVDLPAPQIG